MKRLMIILAVASVLIPAGLLYAEDTGMMGGPGMERGMMMGGDMMGRGMMGDGMMGGKHHMLWKALMNLNLTEQQKEKIEAIRDKTLKETIKKKADLQIAKIDLRSLLDKENVDMNAVESQLKTMESLKTDIRLSHIKAFEEIKATLTPDQRKQFKEKMEEWFMMRGKGMKCGNRRGMMGGMMQQKGMEMPPPDEERGEQPEM
jgi:Spy/CpxP family protein refolding chaperone